MYPNPEVLFHHRRGKPRVSVILIDWGVRESFHSLHYLNRQTAPRDDYELIWLEFYDRKPEGLRRMAARAGRGSPALDRWIVLGYPDDLIYHKHRLYNVGLLVAEGDVCVICDSDAVFRPTFIETLIRTFAETPNAVVHLDEVRNLSHAYYPFNYPDIEEVLAGGANWRGTTTLGLDNSPDMLHHANYGACMAARRRDLLAIGGADEHLDYLGYVCGPYDMTFRLINHGRVERWLRDEYLYHTWHPGQYGCNTDHHGPHDGMHMALLSLEARALGRVRPWQKNPWVARARGGLALGTADLLGRVSERPEPGWRAGRASSQPEDRVYWVEKGWQGFDVFYHAGRWYGLRTGQGRLNVRELRRGGYPELWQAESKQELHARLEEAQRPAASVTGGWLPGVWRKVRSQPLRRLPLRVARKARRLIASKTAW